MAETSNKNRQFVNGALGAVLAILLILTVLSAALLAMRLFTYIKNDDRELSLKSNMDTEFNLFSVQYKNNAGEVVVYGADEQKVVAPGTAVEYTIRLRNTDSVALDYELIPEVTYTSEHALPILMRMLDSNGNYLIGSATTWVTAEEIAAIQETRTLRSGESTEYVFQWKWLFEADNDEYDTFLGNLSTDTEVGISVKFDVYSVANTDIEINGGLVQSGLGDILFAGLSILLLIIAIILTIVVLVKKRR